MPRMFKKRASAVPLFHCPTIWGLKLWSTSIDWQPTCTCFSCVPPPHCHKFLGQKKTRIICFPVVPLFHCPTTWGLKLVCSKSIDWQPTCTCFSCVPLSQILGTEENTDHMFSCCPTILGFKLCSTSIDWQPTCNVFMSDCPTVPNFGDRRKHRSYVFLLSHCPTIWGLKLYSTSIDWQPTCTCFSCVPPSHCPKFLGQKKTDHMFSCCPTVPPYWDLSYVA